MTRVRRIFTDFYSASQNKSVIIQIHECLMRLPKNRNPCLLDKQERKSVPSVSSVCHTLILDALALSAL